MKSTNEFLRVKNFEKYQHYSRRKPPWIKVYFRLLSDSDFSQMSDASKLHTIAIMLLASQYDNKIPFDKPWISRVILANSRINWPELFNSGFVICYQDASNVLADCQQHACIETEVQKYRDTEAEVYIASSDESLSAFELTATNGKFQVATEWVEKWAELYPAVDITTELRNMEGWLLANKTKRKTMSGMPRFINNWLSGQQNKPHKIQTKEDPWAKYEDPEYGKSNN